MASNFIEGVQNPHVKNKLRSYQIKNLKEIFGHAIHEDQKQKIRALDFGVNSKPESILNCDINVTREKACFKCGSNSHFIKDCPLSKHDTKVPQGKYTNQKTNTNTSSTPDKVMGPLTRLSTDLIEQLRLLTPSGHNPHNGHPTYKGNGQYSQKWAAYPISHWQHGATTHHRHSSAHRVCINDQRHQTDYIWKGHCWDGKTPVGHNRKYVTKPHTRIHEVESCSKCDSECSVASDLEEHLDEEDVPTPDSPKKLVYPSQDMKNVPENLRGVPFVINLSGIHLVLYILHMLVLRLKLSIWEESLTTNVL